MPVVQIGLALDGLTYLVLHYQPFPKIRGAATPAGEIERVAASDFRGRCREIILASLDGFNTRVSEAPSEYQRLGAKGGKALHRTNRHVSICFPILNPVEGVVEFAANHLRPNGLLEGCDPDDRVRVQRDEGNDAFLKALDTALSRCRAYPPMPSTTVH